MAETLYFSSVRKNAGGVSIEETYFDSDARFQEHGHDFYEFLFVTQGGVVQKLNGKPLHMAAGTASLVGPGDSHSLRRSSYSECARLYNIAFGADLYERLRYGLGAGELPHIPIRLAPEEMHFLLSQIDQMKLLDLTNRDLVHTMNCTVLSAALSFVRKNYYLPAQAAQDPPLWLEKCTASISEPVHFVKGVQRMVELAGVSQEHLTRELKKYYGVTPSRMIGQLRLEQSRKLLRETAASVTEIALRCGFNNLSYFNRSFRQLYGCSPNEYRRAYRLCGLPAGPYSDENGEG